MDVAHFDRRLCEMKLQESSRRMQIETRAAWRRVGFEQQKLGQGKGTGFYAKLVDAALSVLQECLKDVDRICREVWEAQGGTVTSQFLRAVVRDYAVFTAIAARCGAIRGEIELMARRTGFRQTTPVLRHFALEKRHLQTTLSNRYETEAREIELKNAHRVSKAPSPATELRGSHVPPSKPPSPNSGERVPKPNELNAREKKIWEVIQRGSKGLQYCRELENASVKPRRTGIWKRCPAGTYRALYQIGAPWRHRIQDEKSKIRLKAKLVEARNSLAGE